MEGVRAIEGLGDPFNRVDRAVVHFMARHAVPFLRVALAIVYVWFGALKVLGVSPVAELVEKMAFGMPKGAFVRFLGLWEVVVGLALLFRFALRLTLALFAFQMAGTFLVFVVSPREAYRKGNPLSLTHTGEFVVKNLVLLAAGMVVAGTVGSGREEIDD